LPTPKANTISQGPALGSTQKLDKTLKITIQICGRGPSTKLQLRLALRLTRNFYPLHLPTEVSLGRHWRKICTCRLLLSSYLPVTQPKIHQGTAFRDQLHRALQDGKLTYIQPWNCPTLTLPFTLRAHLKVDRYVEASLHRTQLISHPNQTLLNRLERFQKSTPPLSSLPYLGLLTLLETTSHQVLISSLKTLMSTEPTCKGESRNRTK